MAAYNQIPDTGQDNLRAKGGRNMQCSISELKYKEIINVNTGMRLGYVSDALFDTQTGRITALMAPGGGRVFGLFRAREDYLIPWECIKRIGDDIILADAPDDFRSNRRNNNKY